MNNKNYHKKAFTLVELAIVVVIIGLLVGGVLQGQELIEQAKVRSQVKQFEGFNAASMTFKSKYGFLPGDLPYSKAQTFGLPSATIVNGTANEPNGNGMINDQNNGIPPQSAWAEPRFFFMQMKQANLLKAKLEVTNVPGTWDIGQIFPELEIGVGGSAAVSLSDGLLYYFLGPNRRNDTSNSSGWGSLSPTPSLTPEEASAIDTKLDDGNPSAGGVRATILGPLFSNDTTLNSCLGANNGVYNIASNNINCRLLVRGMS